MSTMRGYMPGADKPKKESAGSLQNTTAESKSNDLDFPTTARPEKAFTNLRAAFAMRGHTLHRTDPKDGPVTFWAERWGLVRHLPTIDTVRQFLEQIGGRL